MKPVTDQHPLLSLTRPPAGPPPPEPLLEELRELAGRHDHCRERSRVLYEQLRKMLGQDRLVTCLHGIQALAMAAEPAGARLLAALLDANTPGSVLLPRVRGFRSTGRLLAADREQVGATFLGEWCGRLNDLIAACSLRCTGAVSSSSILDGQDRWRAERSPLLLLNQTLAALWPGPPRRPAGKTTPRAAALPADDQRLLAGLIRLECEAYQERISRLAGSIDPYRVTAVMRVLPLLSRADAEIRDLGLLATWLENGEFGQVFERRIPTAWDVLAENERPRLTAALQGEKRLAPLAAVHAAFLEAPLSVRQLAGPVARLLVLSSALTRENLREEPLHLLDAVSLVLCHGRDGCLHLPLTEDLGAAVGCSLLSARQGGRDDLAGLEIHDGTLILQQPRLTLGDRIWRHDLPVLQEIESEAPPAAISEAQAQDPAAAADADASAADKGADKDAADSLRADTSTQAVKQLVMNNIGCVSIMLGFLRNPKVTSIPGLVADVVRRTRSGRILEIIAGDRSLTSGHANKDVPRALLESPVNISVKTLRQFIHVKYVSKTDLRRLARDKARLRKEVCQEIEKYLESLT